MKNIKFLNRIKKGITTKDQNAEIYLFGSRARGDFHPDSDWDILVLTDEKIITFDLEKEFRDPIFDIELETGEVISLLVYSKKDWEAKQNISPLFMNIRNEVMRI